MEKHIANRKTTESKSKTFSKGIDPSEAFGWFAEQLEPVTSSYQPEGTCYSPDGLSPHDPVYELNTKIIITVTRVEVVGE